MIRWIIAPALLLAALPAAAQSSPACPKGGIVRETDPETGALILKTALTPKADSFDPLLVWASDEPDEVTFVVMGNAAAPKYGKCHTLALLADGRAVPLGASRYDGANSGDRVLEYVAADLAWAEAEKLATVKGITYKLCKDDRPAEAKFVCQAREVIEAAGAWRKEQAGKLRP
ncbi:MAG TPA: hypothetical protein VF789_11380 [Thermoanaerobaculia bacterium]